MIRTYGYPNALGAPLTLASVPSSASCNSPEGLELTSRSDSHYAESSGFTAAMNPQPIAMAIPAMANQWIGK